MRVAVVGSGIAGLTTAWLLSRDPNVHVVLFEAAPSLGMDSHGADVVLPARDTNEPERMRIDLPLRVFSEDYYPNLCALYRLLGLKLHREDYSASMSSISPKKEQSCFFRYENVKVGALSICVVNQMRLLFSRKFLAIVLDSLRFFRLARAAVRNPDSLSSLQNKSFQEWLSENKFSDAFVNFFMMPSMACVCTCSYDNAGSYPADVVIRYLCDRFHVGVLRVASGTQDVTKKLTANVKEIRLNAHVQSVAPRPGGVVLQVNGRTDAFDHVVFATPANGARHLLKDCSEFSRQREILSRFRFETSSVILHTDPALMPTNKDDWKPLNVFIDETRDKPQATIWMNRAQTNLGTSVNLFQTWNPLSPPDPDQLLACSSFERPVIDRAGRQAQRDLASLQGQSGVWFCGAYVEEGVPLLEAGCRSGVAVAQAITGQAPPWTVVRHFGSMTTGGWRAWVQAARVPAHPMIALPILLGTILYAWLNNAEINWPIAGALQLWGFIAQCFALFVNDVADELADNDNDTFTTSAMRVSGGSRVLQEKKLSADELLVGAIYATITQGVLVIALAYAFGLYWLPILAFVAMFGAYSYSFPPFSYMYRGFGEITQGLLLGLMLPVMGYYSQSRELLSIPLVSFAPAILVFTASNIITGLPDAPSDAQSGKQTLAVRAGSTFARISAHAMTCASMALLFFTLVSAGLPLSRVATVFAPAWVSVLISTAFLSKADVVNHPKRCSWFVMLLSIAHFWVIFAWILAANM